MLRLKIPSREFYDHSKEEFVTTKEKVLQLEHSLVSISKWESKWCKAFLTREQKTEEETRDYVRCMTINPNVEDSVYDLLTPDLINSIKEYIDSDMTATTFRQNPTQKTNRETITSELIYFWMVSYNIPFECQKWHLNRLLTLINVCNVKNNPPKKMNKKEMFNKNRALNESRKKQLNSVG